MPLDEQFSVRSNNLFDMNPTSTASTHEQITRRAFKIWCVNGRLPGTANDNWRAAELAIAREREHETLTDHHDAQDATD